MVQAGAGLSSEFRDQDFVEAGAEVLGDANAVMNKARFGVIHVITLVISYISYHIIHGHYI